MKTKLIVITLLSLSIFSCDDASEKAKSTDKKLNEELNPEKATVISFEKELSLQGTDFKVQSFGEGSEKELIIEVKGQENGDDQFKKEILATVYDAQVEDLNSDGFPEILVFLSEAGSGSYGDVIGYSSNNGKSMSEIAFAQNPQDSIYFKGYSGHDEFEIVETSLMRKFPIYKDGDVNAQPTGGWRFITYKLVEGEALRQFIITDVRDEE